MTMAVRPALPHEAKTFLEVHHAAVRGIAAADYPPEVIEAWAPLPITEAHIARVSMNPESEIRYAAVVDDAVVRIGALILASGELRACYVAPHTARRGVGKKIVDMIEKTARENRLASLWLDSSLTAEPFYLRLGYISIRRAVHILGSGQPMTGIRMRKDL